jgi:pimeloyl-ACP methyl ester carboxylesterase
MGFEVAAIARGADKAELAKKLGAHHYIDSAATDPVAALQALGGTQVILGASEVPNRLKTDFRCVAYDHRGWGESDKPETSYSVHDLANDAEALIQTLGLMRYVLIGHSMGGKVAQLLAAKRPGGPKH